MQFEAESLSPRDCNSFQPMRRSFGVFAIAGVTPKKLNTPTLLLSVLKRSSMPGILRPPETTPFNHRNRQFTFVRTDLSISPQFIRKKLMAKRSVFVCRTVRKNVAS